MKDHVGDWLSGEFLYTLYLLELADLSIVNNVRSYGVDLVLK